MTDGFFDKVYKTRGTEQTRDLYDAWSKTYDEELAQNNYVTPQRCADALARFVDDKTQPLLDFGCGTGMSGLALRMTGFSVIDGRDLSPGMLAQARQKGIYRDLAQIGPDDPLPGGYGAIAAIGVIGSGAAPISVLDRIVEALPPKGKTVFSFNDHTLEDPVYQARVDALIDAGIVMELCREYGDHLPGQNINSMIYVIEKQ
ncbi:class I SAM-dependent DNA methyltransferase [Primorskyibacter sp. 2E233]|uniref:class I SAM-dependent DNA methyltransferase n=1 Tax=Primorskyibacter sp. 2E233 TaxID=3413431 RepID=UPI003BF0D192